MDEGKRPAVGAVVPGVQRQAVLAVGAATAIDLAAVAVLSLAWLKTAAEPTAFLVSLALHLAAAAVLPLVPGLPRSRRHLLLALGLTMPVVGMLAAAFPLWGCGRLALAEVLEVEDERPAAPLEPRLIAEVGEALSPLEALLVASIEDRRATLWALGVRADRESITILRWMLRAAPTEMGVEAALALEDISNLFEKNLAARRREVEASATRAAVLDAARHIAHGFDVGLLDAVQYEALVVETRRYFALARELDPAAAAEVALDWAHLELTVLRPDLALDVLDRDLPAARSAPLEAQLRTLREEAVLQSHDLPWEGPSLLGTYRHTLPLLSLRGRAGHAAPPALRDEQGRGARRSSLGAPHERHARLGSGAGLAIGAGDETAQRTTDEGAA